MEWNAPGNGAPLETEYSQETVYSQKWRTFAETNRKTQQELPALGCNYQISAETKQQVP